MPQFDISSIVPHLVTIGTAIIVSIISWSVWSGKVDARLDQMDEARKDSADSDRRLDDQFNALNVTLEKISVALWGISGENGLRSEVKELKADLKELRNEINRK